MGYLKLMFLLCLSLHSESQSQVKTGFQKCKEDGHAASICQNVSTDYLACRKEASASQCIDTQGGYEACRKEGFPSVTCVGYASGYEACRKNGLAPGHLPLCSWRL